jgi:hypothetical protein
MSDDSSAQTPPNMIAAVLINIFLKGPLARIDETDLRSRSIHVHRSKRRQRQPLLQTLPSLLAKREPGGQFHIREEACFPRIIRFKIKRETWGWIAGERRQTVLFRVTKGGPLGNW